jgi:heme/copper-type cytochrome/quinol oxidase subunit 3
MPDVLVNESIRRDGNDFLPPPGTGPGGGDEDRPDTPLTPPLIGNAQLAMVIFIFAEVMFFTGLIGAFLVFRFSGQPWPPPFQPRLPVGVTAVNTVFLLASSYTFIRAKKSIKNDDSQGLCNFLALTASLGLVFLLTQGYEWLQLLNFGLRVSTGTYASTFYTIVGAHAFHVSSAVLWLLVVLIRAWRGHFSPENAIAITTCGMYWHLVVGLWPVLFFLVYLM